MSMSRAAGLVLVALAWMVCFAVPSAAGQDGGLPEAYVGHWEGSATQVNPSAEWPLRITLTGGPAGDIVGTIDYPTLACGGELRLTPLTDEGGVELDEIMTYGKEVCADGGVVALIEAADGGMEYRWSHPTVNSPATGSLSRVGAEPVALRIPSLSLDAAVEARDIVDGRMQDPSGPWKVAWYRQTGWPGAPGNAVMYGYPDWEGLGPVVFYELPDVRVGDDIEVIGADCLAYAYRVASVDLYEAAEAPLDELFAATTDAEMLTLFSFTEPYNEESKQYERIAVVVAERTEAEPASVEQAAAATPALDACSATTVSR